MKFIFSFEEFCNTVSIVVNSSPIYKNCPIQFGFYFKTKLYWLTPWSSDDWEVSLLKLSENGKYGVIDCCTDSFDFISIIDENSLSLEILKNDWYYFKNISVRMSYYHDDYYDDSGMLEIILEEE